jgi:hypothetical protein
VDEEDRDEGRIAALGKTLQSFADASRRAEDAPSGPDRAEAGLEAQALRRVAWALTSDEDDEAEPATT